jgi:hypothetical protein
VPTRTLPLAAIAVLTSALPCVSAVTARATRTVALASHITIKGKGLTFSGTVSSGSAACKQGRTVTLYRKPSLTLASTTTSSSGHWKITVSGSAGITLGHFYAKAKKRSEGTAGTIYVCKAAASATVAYTP